MFAGAQCCAETGRKVTKQENPKAGLQAHAATAAEAGSAARAAGRGHVDPVTWPSCNGNFSVLGLAAARRAHWDVFVQGSPMGRCSRSFAVCPYILSASARTPHGDLVAAVLSLRM